MTTRLLLLLLLFAAPARANIETEDGAVVSPELPTIRSFFRYTETVHVRDARVVTAVQLGVTPKLELRLRAPLVFRRVSFPGGAEQLVGPADVELRAKYSLWQHDEVMHSTRWSALAEISAPAGNDDRRDDGLRLPHRLQLSTGSWGGGLGTVFTVVRDRHRFSADAWYRHRTRHEGFRPGPTLHLDVAYWFRLYPARFEPEDPRPIEVRPVIELLSTYRASTGAGYEVWLAPGVQLYLTQRVQLELNVRVPLVDNAGDALGDNRWGAGLSIKIRF